MKYGIAKLSVIPVRRENSHRSEQVTQLLFGEVYELTRQSGEWISIRCIYDGYEGWINQNQYCELTEREFQLNAASQQGVALELLSNAVSSNQSIPVVAGSSLPFFDGMNLKVAKEKFIYNGQAIQQEGKTPAIFERVALRYLNAPYLWGGRSPFGIDCSGLTQVVFKFIGIPLLRDAYQQAGQGSLVHLMDEAQPGDLAFFNNEEGKITHTGIILKDGRIIHSAGKVRMDKIDHFGIFNESDKKYSHHLKTIRRLF